MKTKPSYLIILISLLVGMSSCSQTRYSSRNYVKQDKQAKKIERNKPANTVEIPRIDAEEFSQPILAESPSASLTKAPVIKGTENIIPKTDSPSTHISSKEKYRIQSNSKQQEITPSLLDSEETKGGGLKAVGWILIILGLLILLLASIIIGILLLLLGLLFVVVGGKN